VYCVRWCVAPALGGSAVLSLQLAAIHSHVCAPYSSCSATVECDVALAV
jgi:hypothetical protein